MDKQDMISKLYEIDPRERKEEWNGLINSLVVGHESFFRYRTGNEDDINSINDSYIWLSNPKNFNDPYDTDIYIDIKKINGSLTKKFRESKLCEIDQKFSNIKDNIINSTYISCFTEGKDDLLMWAHYANNHEGLCFEYKTSNILEGILAYRRENKTDSCCFMPVSYQNNLPILADEDYKKLVYSYGKKGIVWSCEKEWRIVVNTSKKHGKNIVKKRYIKAKEGIYFTNIIPSKIYMGYKIENDKEEKLKKVCKEKGIKLYKAKKKEREFGLEFDEIDCTQ